MRMIICLRLQTTMSSLSLSVRYDSSTNTCTQNTQDSCSKVFFCLYVFQLTPVNTVVFTVQATDADNDEIIYSIDQTSVSSTFLLCSVFLHNITPHTQNHWIIANIRVCVCVSVLQPDAQYFRVDLPNSGEVILSKPLDYETKTLLTVTIHASVNISFL